MFKRLVEIEVDFEELTTEEIQLLLEDLLFRMKNDDFRVPISVVSCILEILLETSSVSEIIKALAIASNQPTLKLSSEELGVSMDIDLEKWKLSSK